MKDIENRSDIDALMEHFYTSLLADPNIGYIFTDVAAIDLKTHLPKIGDFWEQNLFGSASYRNNVLQVHLDINSKEKLTPQHFQTWLSHFEATVNSMFAGINAEKIKTRALSIATVMQIKVGNQPNFPA